MGNAWDDEYQNPSFITLHDEPQPTVKRFFKYLKKERGIRPEGLTVFDAGCGTGRNANWLASKGATVYGLDISPAAISLAKERGEGLLVDYEVGSLAEQLPYSDAQFDIVLDVTSSNALKTDERIQYLQELYRIMKPGAWMYVRTLCKDGDKNAQTLLKQHPGSEKDMYIMPQTDIEERVFTKKDLETLYSKHFSLEFLKKEHGYSRIENRQYKRFFWIMYAQKPE